MVKRLKTKIVSVNITELRFDKRVNREVDERRVARMAANFNPDAIGVIDVWEREDGRYVVVDGQHRVVLMKEVGWGDQSLPAVIHRDMTLAEAAALFIDVNTYRPMSHTQKFMKRVTAGDQQARAVNGLVKEQGWSVDVQCADKHITATSALEAVYVGKGMKGAATTNAEVLHNTLETIRRAWAGSKDSLQGSVIQGVGLCFLQYNGRIDKPRMVTKLSKQHPNNIIADARTWRRLQGSQMGPAMAAVIAGLYNKGARTHRLDDE